MKETVEKMAVVCNNRSGKRKNGNYNVRFEFKFRMLTGATRAVEHFNDLGWKCDMVGIDTVMVSRGLHISDKQELLDTMQYLVDSLDNNNKMKNAVVDFYSKTLYRVKENNRLSLFEVVKKSNGEVVHVYDKKETSHEDDEVCSVHGFRLKTK